MSRTTSNRTDGFRDPRTTMNHLQFVKKVARHAGKPIIETDAVVRSMLAVTADELRTTGNVSLLGIGKLSTRLKPAHKARNPKTHAVVDVAERQVVRFKASSTLIV